MRAIVIFICAILITTSSFANLPYYPLKFPRDEGSHHENIPYKFPYLIEKWTLSGKLISADNDQLDYHFSMIDLLMNDDQLYSMPVAIMQVTDIKKQKTYTILNQYSMNSVYFDSSDLRIEPDEANYFDKEDAAGYHLIMNGDDGNDTLKFSLHFDPDTTKLSNQKGLIQMPGEANAYQYIMTNLLTSGSIEINGQKYWIPFTNGGRTSFLEHTWGDFSLQQYGWESLAIRLDNGLFAHVFVNVEMNSVKLLDGFMDVVLPDGSVRNIPSSRFTITRKDMSKVNNHSYPKTFEIDIPELNLHIITKAGAPLQEDAGYYSGYANVDAVYNKRSVQGSAHNELLYYV